MRSHDHVLLILINFCNQNLQQEFPYKAIKSTINVDVVALQECTILIPKNSNLTTNGTWQCRQHVQQQRNVGQEFCYGLIIMLMACTTTAQRLIKFLGWKRIEQIGIYFDWGQKEIHVIRFST